MTTRAEILQSLEGIQKEGFITFHLSEPRFSIGVDRHDKVAAELIRHIREHYPELTAGDALDALDMARWWIIAWQALVNDDEPAKEPES